MVFQILHRMLLIDSRWGPLSFKWNMERSLSCVLTTMANWFCPKSKPGIRELTLWSEKLGLGSTVRLHRCCSTLNLSELLFAWILKTKKCTLCQENRQEIISDIGGSIGRNYLVTKLSAPQRQILICFLITDLVFRFCSPCSTNGRPIEGFSRSLWLG
jgi:hypothetical protein